MSGKLSTNGQHLYGAATLERRSVSSLSLKRLESSPEINLGNGSLSGYVSSSQGSSPRMPEPGGSTVLSFSFRRGYLALTLILGLLGSSLLFLSLLMYSTTNISFRSFRTTSYVSVNYWPYVVNNDATRLGPENNYHSQGGGRFSGVHSGGQYVELKLGSQASPKRQTAGVVSTKSNRASEWPAESPDWEMCFSRGEEERIRTTGSVFGYFSMYLRCPAAPAFKPALTFSSLSSAKQGALDARAGDETQSPDLLIGIFSGCQSVVKREAVRQTWMRLVGHASILVRAVFVVSGDCKDQLDEEQKRHGDIRFMPVRESYFTLTPKALALLRVGLDAGARYIMKTDDDSFVFVDRVAAELQRLIAAQPEEQDQPCLYWGRRCSVPLLTDYDNPKLPLFQTSVSKWYYPPHYLRHFEGTAYMCGAAYLLSASLAKKVLAAELSHKLSVDAPFLPEDASVGHLVGPKGWESCSCQDNRFILDARRYHGRKIFADGVDDCKRAEIFSHALSAHGLQPEQMSLIMGFNASRSGQSCGMGGSCEGCDRKGGAGFSQRSKGQKFDEWLWQEPLEPLQPQFPEIQWVQRLEMPPKQPPPEAALVPLLSMLKAQHTPWCVRHGWAIQIAEHLADLAQKQVLECKIGIDTIYVDPASMQIKINEESDTMAGYSNDAAFAGGTPCYADNMCDRCFLPESREGLLGTLCSPRTWTCKGYGVLQQAKVVSHKVLHPLIGRFMHDTPTPQEKYRSAVDAALGLPDIGAAKPESIPRMMVKSFRAVYETFNGQECTDNWISNLSTAGEVA